MFSLSHRSVSEMDDFSLWIIASINVFASSPRRVGVARIGFAIGMLNRKNNIKIWIVETMHEEWGGRLTFFSMVCALMRNTELCDVGTK